MKTYEDLCSEARECVREIDAATLAERIRTNTSTTLIDLREPDELDDDGLIGGSVLVPRGTLEKAMPALAPDPAKAIHLYCATGKRGLLAARQLHAMGYENVVNLAGGIAAWREAGLAVEPRFGSAPTVGGSRPHPAVDLGDWDSIRRDFPITNRRVRCAGGVERGLVYMDHAATTHPPATILRLYTDFLANEYANVHRATHHLARESTLRFEEAYRICGEFIGADVDAGCVVFTANTTGACELVAHAMAPYEGKVLLTDVEHHSNDLPYRRRGEIVRLGMTDDARLDLEEYEAILKRERVKLVAVTGAANVTGWMPPIHEMARLAHQHGARICVDAAQLLAHAAVDVRPVDHPEHIDFLTAAGHKMYAPFGAGFLYGPRDLLDAVEPLMPGGGTAGRVRADDAEWLASPDRHQGGTPNIAGCVAMAGMLQYLAAIGMDRVREHEMVLYRRAWEGLESIGGITLYGPPDLNERVGIVPFNVEGVNDMLTAAILGEEGGVAVRNGRFCAHVHSAELFKRQGGLTPLEGEDEDSTHTGAVRAAIGLYNNEADVDWFLEMVRRVRDREWTGNYSVQGGQVSGQYGGRCADSWMTAAE